ncbi:hypothetical protein RW1_057_00230 [Rhodococcus wratislaviensis NBRC 100605]|uniref:Uncharacterized protein n=1 Tax=Rhodococcus wratislaviensis NBRC 100605 TaxID=1219028 RepID=X0PYR2_RHOWR|nr:hypothetical protein RW1_057_00230 [Rhodococcus wratislaviensis NBRC 100605]
MRERPLGQLPVLHAESTVMHGVFANRFRVRALCPGLVADYICVLMSDYTPGDAFAGPRW